MCLVTWHWQDYYMTRYPSFNWFKGEIRLRSLHYAIRWIRPNLYHPISLKSPSNMYIDKKIMMLMLSPRETFHSFWSICILNTWLMVRSVELVLLRFNFSRSLASILFSFKVFFVFVFLCMFFLPCKHSGMVFLGIPLISWTTYMRSQALNFWDNKGFLLVLLCTVLNLVIVWASYFWLKFLYGCKLIWLSRLRFFIL